MTYYEILGITKEASADEIKKAYRKLASVHHPDKGGDTTKFQEIQVAYDTLSDPTKKQQYDMQLSGTRHQHHSFNDLDIDEVLRTFGFSFDMGSPFGRQQPRRNRDLRIEIPVTLESTLADQTKIIQIKTAAGTNTPVEVKIPRGVIGETTVKYSGLGDDLFTTLPRGDLYVHFNVQNADNFQANGLDLYTKVNVNCLLSIVGGKVTVIGLDNKQFELTLPKGTQAGMKFRIPQNGLYQLNSTVRGDLYVEIALTVPTDLTEEHLASIQSIINSL